MKSFLTALLILCAAFYALRLMKAHVNFANAPSELAVTRIDPDGTVVHETLLPLSAPYLAVYHGAGWCGPCQRFSPELAEFYHSADRSARRFQLVMVNYDRSEDDMLACMRQHKMEFPAVIRGSAGAWGRATGNGIPNLIIIDTATGKVVASSYDGGAYVGPGVPLEALKKIAR
ncbi:MAG TPA: thioredoxin-like domain-containing protein [Opitutaceae bacterium]|nr:thioredoxin-like domain-containing protein [Opitutaceae bacterium]